MPATSDRLRVLRRQARIWSADLRPYALAVDRDPGLMRDLVDLPSVRMAASTQVPPPYSTTPMVIDGHTFHLTSAVERSVWCEETACGDLGIALGSPGPSMCGVLVDALADPDLKSWFYEQVQAEPTWTFFALTEPDGGTDPGQMRTRLTAAADGALTLDGEKRYVSNAVRARFGVVFARTGPGPYSVDGVLVETAEPGFTATPIPTLGLRGAQLGELTLDRIPVTAGRRLGAHLPRLRRGTLGWLRTLNLLRPTVAAMAVGLARAAYEYVREHRTALSAAEQDRLAYLRRRIWATRCLTLDAAAAVDRDIDDSHLGSAAKQRAARLADSVTREALTFFGPGARLEHPLLDKYVRDAAGLEFMEGTSFAQHLKFFGAVSRGVLHPDAEPAQTPQT